MPFSFTDPQIGAQPVQFGPCVATSETTFSTAATFGPVWDIDGVPRVALRVVSFGTIPSDCGLRLELSFDGTGFSEFVTYAKAQYENKVIVADVKAKKMRLVLVPGSLAVGANGLNITALI